MKTRHWTFAATLMLVSGLALASNPYMEYKDHIKASQSLAALKDNLFGDNVSLYNGATEFTATDIDIPGNNALPVQLVRRLSIEIVPSGPAADWDSRIKGAGNWDIDVPSISGTYISSGHWPNNRCTVSSMPSAPGFSPTDFWHGNPVHIPGGGDRPLLGIEASTPRPSDAYTYKWTTRERDSVSCITSVKAGGAFGGEGFRLRTASGLIYTFDVAIERYVGYMKRPIPGTANTYSLDRAKDYLLASKVEDRFGNYVTYTYNSQGHPTQISSNDGRTITLTYDATGAFLDHASVNTGSAMRTWTYAYGSGATAGMLTSVTLPDTHKWSFAYSGSLNPYMEDWSEDPGANCNLKPPITEATFAIAITHPSGAMGTFGFGNTRHFRSGVHHGECIAEQQQSEGTWVTVHRLHTPHYFDVMSLYYKTITGPGLDDRTWSYDYGVTHEDLYGTGGQIIYPCTSGCDTEKVVTVTNPDATSAQYHYGMLYAVNEGRVLSSSILDASGVVKRTQTTTYMTDAQSAGQNFFTRYGIIYGDDDPSQAAVRPVVGQTTIQDGVTFGMTVEQGCPSTGIFCFDSYANPTKVTKASTLGYSRTEQTAYLSDTIAKPIWVLGQVATVTCMASTPASAACDGQADSVESEATYSSYAMPLVSKAFAKPQQTLAYDTTSTVASGLKGTLKTVTDGNGNVTTLSSWYRGVPRLITYPATTDQPTAATMSASVDDNGWITSVVDENGYSTGYGYDTMGRLASIVYPIGDSTAWNDTTITYQQVTATEYGIPTGHWKRTESTGNGRKITYYDGMWRPLVEEQYDNTNATTITNTRSLTVKRYDLAGQLAFQAYPLASLTTSYSDTSLKGTATTYDALDRVLQVAQDWEGTPKLTTTTQYLPGFKTQVTNPRTYVTLTSFMAFDQPTNDWPVDIDQADGQTVEADTDIARDVFGKPTAITRHNPTGSVTETRSYVYDVNQLLCKSVEPESSATIMAYDGANNVVWSAGGQSYTSTTSCDTAAVANGDKTNRTYDGRNRLKTLRFPDQLGDQDLSYTPDNLPAIITTYNAVGQTRPLIDSYHYNKRRMPDGSGESLEWPGWYTWSVGHGYDANGHLSVQIYPAGQSANLEVDYVPNALGQPTQAGSFATGVTYYPNGAIKHFVYGNGIVHDMHQNDRQLPDWSKDANGATNIIYDNFTYDNNGNVAAISDGLPGAHGDRTMVYDALDRLTSTASPMFGNGASGTTSFTYDALDNLTKLVMPATANSPARTQYYCYDANWRLASLRTATNCGGSIQTSLTYDAQGNLASKGTQAFTFGKNNRLYNAPTAGELYYYDAQGHRTLKNAAPGNILSQYSRDGQLLQDYNVRTGFYSAYVWLGGSLVAIQKMAISGGAITVEYQHTDALGTPVAVTSSTRAVLERSEYEPYGQLLNRPQHDGPGFTGHVQDALTGLTYMQQRYYDPMIGRFLSVDPVTANEKPGQNFNRYWYANNNPYSFTDPDGREVRLQWHEVVVAGIPTGSYHTFLRITPDNQAAYKNTAVFQQNADANGRSFATIGAGNDANFKQSLAAGINRSTETVPHDGGIVIPTPSQYKNEDAFVSALFGATANFMNNTAQPGSSIDYDFSPNTPNAASPLLADDGFNSNSFTSGLLQATGASVPQPPVIVPGFQKPVPEEEFEKAK